MSDEPEVASDADERWPTEGDRLFVESTWRYDARVVRDPGERFYRLPMGYKRAGDLLTDQAAIDLVDRRNVIYAALFCYRQAIELYLKQLIDQFGKGSARPPRPTHDLSRLWQSFMYLVSERGLGETLGLTAAAKLVAEIHEADQQSDGFRFPEDRRAAPFKFGDVGVDLDNLRDVMNGLENFFQCVRLALSNETEIV